MDYPLKYLLESIVKKVLRDFFEQDNLSLDSISLFNTSGVLRNLILRANKINDLIIQNDIGITVLSGMIEEITIEAYLFDKQVQLGINGVHLSVLLPYSKLEKLFFPKPKNYSDILGVSLNLEDNKKNKIYSLLEKLTNFIINVSNVNIDIFIDFEDYLFQYKLNIYDISVNQNSKNTSEEESKKSLSSKLNCSLISLLMTTFKKSEREKMLLESEKDIQNFMKNKNLFADEIINDLSFMVHIKAYDFRFDKSELDFSNNNLELKGNFLLQNIENFESNTKIDLTVSKFVMTFNQKVLINLMRFVNLMERVNNHKKERMERCRRLLRNSIEKIKSIIKGRSFMRSQLISDRKKINQSKTESKETCLNYVIYMFLQMIERKYITYNINHYLLMRLLFQYKKIIREDHVILDYLIEQNIQSYLNLPSVSDIGSLFINLDYIEKTKNKIMNKSLKDFLFFLLNKFAFIIKMKKDFNSYDDFFMINFKLLSLKVSLDKVSKIEEYSMEENEEAIISNLLYLRNKFHSGENERQVMDFSNQLLVLEVNDIGLVLYKNTPSDYLFCKLSISSVYMWDITYRKISPETLKRNYLPFLKIEYNIVFNFFKVMNMINLIELDVPTIYSCLDPYCLFFLSIYFSKIKQELKEFKYSAKVEEEEDKTKKGSKNYLENIRTAKITIMRIIINANHSKVSSSQSKSILLNFNKMLFEYNKHSGNIQSNVEELIIGSVENKVLQDFLDFRNNLIYNTNILSLFNIYQVVDYETLNNEKHVRMPLPEIYVKLTKNDILIIENYCFSLNILRKFTPNYKLMYDVLMNNPKIIKHFASETERQSYFTSYKNNQIIEDSRMSEDEMNTPNKTNDFRRRLSLGFSSKIFRNENLFLATKRKENEDDSFFFSFPIVKFVIQIKLTDDDKKKTCTQAAFDKYKHIILVIDNIDCYYMLGEGTKLFLCNIYKLNLIHRTSVSDRKLVEIESKSLLLSMSRSEFIRHKKIDFRELETTFVYFGKESYTVSIISSIPPLYIAVDHMLIKFLIEFLKISNNTFVEEITNETTNLLSKLTKNNTYFRYYIHVNSDNKRKTIIRKTTPKKIRTTVQFSLSFLKVEAIMDDAPFFSLTGSEFAIGYDSLSELLEVKANLYYLRDDRIISSYNKYIIYNLSPCMRFTLNYQMEDTVNLMEIVIENAIGVFIMRSVMDVIEYIYFIFVKDIMDQFPSEIVFNKTPEELEEFDEKEINNLKSKRSKTKVKNFPINQDNSFSESYSEVEVTASPEIKRKMSRNELHRRQGIGGVPKEDYTIEEEKEKSPLKIKFLLKNGEIMLAMNSAKKDKINYQDLEMSSKKDKLIISFSELEYSNYIESDTIRDAYHNFISNRKVLNPEKNTFDINNIEMIVKVKDVRFYMTPVGQTEVDFAWFMNKEDKPDSENSNLTGKDNNFIGSFTLLFEITKEFLSNCKIYLLIPYIRLRLFPDNYEKLLRVCFENMMEEQTVFAEYSLFSRAFYQKHDIEKPYCEFAIILEDVGISQYNFPSSCLSHRSDKLSKVPKVHSLLSDCKFAKSNPPVELDKLCTIKLNNLYIMLRFHSNYEKNIYIETNSLSVELNKCLRAFSKLNNLDLIKTSPRENVFFDQKKTTGDTNLQSKPVSIDIFILKNDVKNFVVNLNSFKVNVISLPLMSLYRFFTKFFFYYQNKNIKIVNHDEIATKIIQLKMKDVELIMQSSYMESNNSFYELDVKCDFDLYMKTIGNTTLGPYIDSRQYGLFIRSIYLNDFKGKKYGKVGNYLPHTSLNFERMSNNNLSYNPNINTFRNQIVDNANIDIEMFIKAEDKLQMNKIFHYQFCKIIGNDYVNKISHYVPNCRTESGFIYEVKQNSLMSEGSSDAPHENVNIKRESPYEFKHYIRNLVFKEKDLIDYSSNQKKSEPESKHKREVQFPEFKTTESNNASKKTHKTIKLSLNLNQIFQMKKIFDDLAKDYKDNYKHIMYPYSEKTSFDVITYNSNYGFSINEVEITLSDSQFNSKLFQITISNLLCFITNTPEDEQLKLEVEKINNKYHNIETLTNLEKTKGELISRYSNFYGEIPFSLESEHEKKVDLDKEKKFNYDLLTKFLVRIYYHNNTYSIWEPFIEPLPAMISYFKSEVQDYILIDVLSLEQITMGLENVCRQREFHSLNVNINEMLLENIRSLNNDYSRNSSKKDRGINRDYTKKLVIKNLTEYKMNIVNIEDFQENKEIAEENKYTFEYKKDQQMSYRENLKVNFQNSCVEEEKKSQNVMLRGSSISGSSFSPKFVRKKPFTFNYNNIISSVGDENSILLEESARGPTIGNTRIGNISPTKKEDNLNDKAALDINIEKTSKLYTILKNERTSNSKKVEMDELRKHFDEKYSILIPGEQFLVSEIDLNIQTNTKSVTFRSNEGIKNDLDFPVKLKFILKDGTPNAISNYYENPVVIEPKFVYYIPPILLDKVKVIEIKPIFPNNDMIEFHSGVYPIDQLDLSADENNFTVVYCKIKTFNATELDGSLYLENIAFAVVKKFEVAEGEYLDNNIKKRIEWIKSYSRFKGKEYEAENKKRLEQILCDVTYVLSPVIRFYNSLPRDIVVRKMLPEYILNKGTFEEVKIFDIENFIKKYSAKHNQEKNKKKKICNLSPQEYFVSYNKAKYTKFQDKPKDPNESGEVSQSLSLSNSNDVEREEEHLNENNLNLVSNTNNNLEDVGIHIKANGDYLSIYEPYFMQEKFCKYLRYNIRIEEIGRIKEKESGGRRICVSDKRLSTLSGYSVRSRSSSSSNIRKSIKSIRGQETHPKKDSFINSEFIVKPFNFKRILKMNKTSNEFERRSKPGKHLVLNLDPTNTKSEINSYVGSKKDILLHSYEITPNNVMNTHLYCPYLFINSSDLNLLVSYKKLTPKSLPYELKDKNFYYKKENEIDNEFLKRITMFYPEDRKNFKFYICNKTIKQRKQIKILDIASTGKVVGINIKDKKKKDKYVTHEARVDNRYLRTEVNGMEEYDEYTKSYKKKQTINLNSRVLQVDKQDKKVTISMQMELLNNALKWSKLIFITPSIYIFNTTKRDIYIYHFNKNNKGPNKFDLLRSKKTIKFYYLVNYYEFFKISYEDKLNPDDTKLYSGLIRLIPNNEFYVTLSEREGLKTLLFIKVYKVYGFLYVVIKHKESITDYPYFIVNNLNRVTKYKQKEFLDEEMRDFFKFSNTKMNIQVMELPGSNSEISANHHQSDFKTNADLLEGEGLVEIDIPPNVNYYTWDEPFMRNRNNRNILEIIFFGSKFEIDLDDIHEEIKFFDRAKFSEDNMMYINDKPIKGTLSVKDGIKSREFSYSLYEYALYISDSQGRQTKFEFHDRDLGIYRKSNGKIILKKNKEYEMHCISDEETNLLAGRIYKSIEKAREFVNNIIIKKYVKNKSIYVEITNRSASAKIKKKKFRTMFICNIQNIGVSLIQKNYEFMYIWFNGVALALQKSSQKLKKLSLTIKDYQIDHYLNNSYYPIVLSPLCDLTYENNQDYKNVEIEITNLKFSSNFYQVDTVYVVMQSIDLRLEYKFIEKLNSFVSTAKRIFSVMSENGIKKDIRQVVKEIDECNYVDEKVVMSYENFILIKQIMISDLKISFSLKFENIDMFLEKTAFLFLKPLIEELGLKIINMDTSMFTFVPFIRNNIYQSTDEFMNIFSTFYYHQFVSELVKSLGGITSLTSLQIVENLNNNILSNMRMEKNSVARLTKKKSNIKDLYKSGFENMTLIVGGLFMLAFKMMSVVGKFLAYLTFDETFQQRRSYKLNKSVKSLWEGVILAFKILFFTFVYFFTQFYYVPVRMYAKYRVIGILLAVLIIILGIVLKPFLGVTDLTTKILESIAFKINDVFGDRVKKLARYQRNIKDNELRDYNSIDALAYTVYKYMDTDSINTTFEDIQLALPGVKRNKRVLLLFTTDRIIIVDYDDYRFVPKYQIHFSECKLFNNASMQKLFAPHVSILGKRLGFLTNEQGERYLYIYFDAVRRKWCNCSKKSFELRIKLFKFDENSVISERYNAMIENIFKKYSDIDAK